jgi:hypothetical protein
LRYSIVLRSVAFLATLFPLLSVACGDSGVDAGDANGAGASGSGGNGASAGHGGGTSTTPTVVSTLPVAGAASVPLNWSVSARFSEVMDADTLDVGSFTLTSTATQVTVAGAVTYDQTTAVFWPADHLAPLTTYVATIADSASSAAGVALAAPHTWSFTTAAALVPGIPVPLGDAGDYVILAKSGVSSVPASAITGNVGISPAAATFVTGFSLTADASNLFSTSAQVTGKVYSATHAAPTPSDLTTAVGDMELAFTAAAGRAADVTEVGAGDIGGMTLSPGVYRWSTGLLVPTDLALAGSATDVWVFQVAQSLTIANGVQVTLIGGARPENVFWQVAGKVELGTTSSFQGIVLAQTSAALATGASLDGRLLAQSAVTLDQATVVEPSP